MNISINDGGPAFPVVHSGSVASWGLSTRDYFAASASDSDIESMIFKIKYVDVVVEIDAKKVVRRVLPLGSRQIARYMHADAMLLARSKQC